jgi:glutathione peroxidase
MSDFYALQAKDISGKLVSFDSLQGKSVLIVNTASECGYTPQYKDLEVLYQKYKTKGLTVLGFPCNNFGAQEPDSDTQIHTFCEKKYGVTFPMFSKVDVKGENKHPVYKYLTETQPSAETRQEPRWNFTKFLINRKGEVVGFYEPKVEPLSPELTAAIEKTL